MQWRDPVVAARIHVGFVGDQDFCGRFESFATAL